MKKQSDTAKKGYVYIAGAGPGDPELLTLRAERALKGADVIIYDDLVTSAIIDQFSGLKIYTGKRKDSHHFEQDAINEEIARHALEGKTVVRLKGGDPFVFGRGGEEIDVLRKYKIDYEIIPGITAAHGASAYSEIPPHHAQGVLVGRLLHRPPCQQDTGARCRYPCLLHGSLFSARSA